MVIGEPPEFVSQPELGFYAAPYCNGLGCRLDTEPFPRVFTDTRLQKYATHERKDADITMMTKTSYQAVYQWVRPSKKRGDRSGRELTTERQEPVPTMQGGETMKRSLIAIAAVAALMIPAICSATPPVPGPYTSVFAGVSIPENSNVTTNDFYFNNTFNDQVEFDIGAYAGGTAGFDFGLVRLEGELSYRYSEIKSITDTFNGFKFQNVDGNLGALTFMANAFVDLHNASPVTPYFGGGVGFAVLDLSDTFAGAPSQVLLYPNGSEAVFAYQVGAGLEISLNQMFSLDLGYRYFNTDKANFESNPIISTKMDLESHNAMVGLRMKF
jgi:opacity protein-like surface antigen